MLAALVLVAAQRLERLDDGEAARRPLVLVALQLVRAHPDHARVVGVAGADAGGVLAPQAGAQSVRLVRVVARVALGPEPGVPAARGPRVSGAVQGDVDERVDVGLADEESGHWWLLCGWWGRGL